LGGEKEMSCIELDSISNLFVSFVLGMVTFAIIIRLADYFNRKRDGVKK